MRVPDEISEAELERLTLEGSAADFPWMGEAVAEPFADCGPEPLGVYAIVDRVSEVERMLEAGVRTVQLRMKFRGEGAAREAEIERAVALGRAFAGGRVFINDDWELALRAGAYGVHLGQDDMAAMSAGDVERLQAAGVRLGLSTHSFVEMARAWAWRPSYLAIGTVFETTSKVLEYEPLGLERLTRMVSRAPVRIVAIGGMNLERAADVRACGVDGIACISALAGADDLAGDVVRWNRVFEEPLMDADGR